MKLTQQTTIYRIFTDLISTNFSKEDAEIILTTFCEAAFRDALVSSAHSRDYQSEDTRGFGDGVLSIPIDGLLTIIKWLATAIAGKVATDATVAAIYAAALNAIKSMPSTKYDAWQPWSSRLEAYLSNKCK